MTKLKSLVSGIGNSQEITKYYDNWSKDYDKTLNYGNVAPSKSINIVIRKLKTTEKHSRFSMWTGLFGLD